MATNMFIKFNDVTGEATDVNHVEWIEILEWSHSFNQPATPVRDSSGSTIERANHSDLEFTKYLDTATDDLLKACWSGHQFETVDIECFRSDGQNAPIKYLEINLLDVIITNYSISGGGGDVPIEHIALAYSKVTYTYSSKVKEDATTGGAEPVSHNLVTNEIE
jgi:type VI secretion system secreted protein Hcp